MNHPWTAGPCSDQKGHQIRLSQPSEFGKPIICLFKPLRSVVICYTAEETGTLRILEVRLRYQTRYTQGQDSARGKGSVPAAAAWLHWLLLLGSLDDGLQSLAQQRLGGRRVVR